jgi:hypothetical protein
MHKTIKHLINTVFLFHMSFAIAEVEPAPPVSLTDTFQHVLVSESLKQSFQIDVAMPPQPAAAMAGPYPVIYVVDGNGLFPLVYASTRSLQRSKELRPVIVVGIGFSASSYFDIGLLRTEYLTPTSNKAFEEMMNNKGLPLKSPVRTGSADQLVTFIDEELKPFINARYPTDQKHEVFAGYSFGGLFGTYVLFNHPALFDAYVLGSPSLWWDDGRSFSYEETYAKAHSDLAKKVFMSSGTADIEMMLSGARAMKEKLAARNYPKLQFTYLEFDGETHSSGVGVAINRGIKQVMESESP